MQEVINKFKEWLIHLFEVHCFDCEKGRNCQNCEKLFMLLDQARQDNKQLLDMLMGSKEQVQLNGPINDEDMPIAQVTLPGRMMNKLSRESYKRAQEASKNKEN